MIRTYNKSECFMIPYLRTTCNYSHNCCRCDIADRVRFNSREFTKKTFELYWPCDVLRKTEKGGGLDYLYKPLILKPEAMERLGIEVELYNQIFIPTSGAGMFSNFPGSQFDGYILNDRRKIYTISRHDVYGVANEAAVKRYKDLFLIDLHKEARKGAVLMI